MTSAPTLVATGSTFGVTTSSVGTGATKIDKMACLRLGSVTHTFDQDARYVPLVFTPTSGTMTVTAPPTAEEAPAGAYMLFLVNDVTPYGRPSRASMVEVWGIAQSTVADSAFSLNPGTFTVWLKWRTNRAASGGDQVYLHRKVGSTWYPPIAATCVEGCQNTGTFHRGKWQVASCDVGDWYYEVRSSTTGTVTTSISQKKFLKKILNCLD